MVYCGKASQGCQNCRTRRIKCDKIRPDCSQCIRVGKKCPGYRDQLSLMFRDENSKVMQKAHASWGVEAVEGSSSGTAYGARSPSSSKSPDSAPYSTPTTPRDDDLFAIPGYGSFPVTLTNTAGSGHGRSRAAKSEFAPSRVPIPDNVVLVRPPKVPTPELGLEFFLNRYVIGSPDDPLPARFPDWLFHPTSQAIMAAVGLAGLGNVQDDAELQAEARRSYGFALRKTREAMTDPSQMTLDVAVRSAVFLALFEVVKKATDDPINTAQAHILGAGAMMKTILQRQSGTHSWTHSGTPTNLNMLGLVQLAYSMLVPCYNAGTSPPTAYFDWMKLTGASVLPEDRPSTDLLPILANLLQVLAVKRGTVFADGAPRTIKMLQEAVRLDARMAAWEEGCTGKWAYTTVENKKLPPEATFDGRYHTYANMWNARVWNHYRWGRILVNELILSLLADHPMSSLALFGGNNNKASALTKRLERRCTETICRIAEDMLISVPAHWSHPILARGESVQIDRQIFTGAGSIGIPTMLHHILTAACGPGIPHSYIIWSIATVDTIWKTLGMSMAVSVRDILQKHLDKLQRRGSEVSGVVIKIEPLN